MSFLVWTILGVFASVLQVYLSIIFGSEAWTPQLWFIFCLWLATKRERFSALVAIFLTGFWLDGFSGGPMGTQAAMGLIIYLASLQLTERIQLRGIGLIVLGALAGLLSILVGLIAVKVGGGTRVGPQFAVIFGPRIMSMALVAPIFVAILNLIHGLRRNRATLETF
ncbi:MAG: hypothetical protein VYA30_14245 [Myxococcota bacterium]|nr:hypothetical protein [Myxococcota bacterium]